MSSILKIKNVGFTYPNSNTPALDGINLELKEGETALLLGESGSGKSTLLNCIKSEIRPNGKFCGCIFINGINVDTMERAEQVSKIGMVLQDGESQTLMNSVRGEIAFPLENLGIKSEEIHFRMGEVCALLGLSGLLDKSPSELSGGQRQMMALCTALVMRPKLLLLDEPVSSLDPIWEGRITDALRRLNEEWGLSILAVSHRSDTLLPFSTKLGILSKGELIAWGGRQKIIEEGLLQKDGKIWSLLPQIPKLFAHITQGNEKKVPLTVAQSRRVLEDSYRRAEKTENKTEIQHFKKFSESVKGSRHNLLSAESIYFAYQKNIPILKSVDLSLNKGEFLCLFGENGSGKSTLLKIIAGLLPPIDGKIYINGKLQKACKAPKLYKSVFYLPQNAKALFSFDSVREELSYFEKAKLNDGGFTFSEIVDRLSLSHLLDTHPLDLSGGESEKAAIACAALLNTDIILLDEPTKGMDGDSVRTVMGLISELCKRGAAVIAVTHDCEMAARYADKCALIFDRRISALLSAREFLKCGDYYTTTTVRIFREHIPSAVVREDVAEYAKEQ